MNTTELQTKLKELGFYKGKIDGIRGPMTNDATYNYTLSVLAPVVPMTNRSLYAIALAELGQKEVVGGENPRIIEYHSTTSLHATEDEIAWCSSFVNWVCKKAGVASTGSAMARSWLTYGTKVTGTPMRGDIVILQRGNNGVSGHVGFLDRIEGDKVYLLGGNQGDSVSIVPFKKSDILDIRRAK